MDIPALSMSMSSYKVQTGVSVSLMKKALDTMEQEGAQMAEMISETGVSFDVRV